MSSIYPLIPNFIEKNPFNSNLIRVLSTIDDKKMVFSK